MQKDLPPVPANIPQYVYQEDEISLIDVWLTIIKHKRVFWIAFGIVMAMGIVAALVMPKKYSITSSIDIGQTIQNDEVILLESPETVKAKLQSALVPEILSQYEDDDIRLTEFDISVPKNSDLVLIQTKVKEDDLNQFSEIISKMTSAIEVDHERIIQPIRSMINASIKQKELELKRENDDRFYNPIFKNMEMEIKGAEINLVKLQDPTIQGYKLKALEIQLQNEKNQLESIKERESILKTKKERLSQLSDLLIYQIGELKGQIKSSMKLQQESVKQTKSGSQGMAMLMIDNELQQNRNRLATLEERLYIDLENQHSELQKEINDNNRDQLHQLALIDEKQKNLDKYLVENKLDIDQQKTAIAKKEAEKVKIPADREQNVEVLKQQIDVLEEQLSNIINTRAVTEPMRSQKPTSISKLMIIALAFMLATIFGFFATFIAVFRQKVRMHEVENV